MKLNKIILFGPDGSGKTTQALMLAHVVNKMFDRHTIIIRMRCHHLAMFLLIKSLQYAKLLPRTSSPYILNEFLRLRFNKCLETLVWLEVINALLWVLIHEALLRLLKYIIIADRYLVDFIVMILYIINNNKRYKKMLYSIMTRFLHVFTKESLLVYLTVDDHIAIKRKYYEKISPTFIKKQIVFYEAIAYNIKALKIDTSNKTPREVFIEILKHIIDKTRTSSNEKKK